jgi:hypothetical protein
MIRGWEARCPPHGSGRSQRQRTHLAGPGREERFGRCVEGRAGREDVVHEPDMGIANDSVRDPEGASHIGPAFAAVKARLTEGIPAAFESVGAPGSLELRRDPPRDPVGVIESPPAASFRMERNAHHQIGPRIALAAQLPTEFDRQMIDRQSNRDRGSEGPSGGLEARDPATDRPFVAGQGVAAVERTAVGQTAPTGFVRKVWPYTEQRPTTGTTVRSTPAGQIAIASRTERRTQRGDQCVALDAAARCHHVEQRPPEVRPSIHGFPARRETTRPSGTGMRGACRGACRGVGVLG